MNQNRSIALIPNFAIKYSGDELFVPPPDGRLVGELSDDGWLVKLVSFFVEKDDEFSGYRISDLANSRVLPVKLSSLNPKSKLSKAKAYFFALFTLLKEMFRKNDMTYIYFPGNINTIAAVLCIIFRRKYALYVRGIWQEKGVASWLYGFAFKRAQFIYATGVGFCDTLSKYNENVEPVSPMISLTDRLSAKTSNAEQKTHGSKLLFVGHIKESKGVFDVVGAVRELRRKEYDVSLDIVGGGADALVSRLKEEIDCPELHADVNYFGQINDPDSLQRIFRSADIFVYPSYYPEGFPRVVYEAMMSGLAVVCTILPGMKGFMVDGENCMEVSAQAQSQLAGKLELLINDHPYTESLQERGLADVKRYFSQFDGKTHAQQLMSKLEKFSGQQKQV